MKYSILIFALFFGACNANKIHKQTDRESDGFAGKVVNVYISTVFPLSGKCPKKSYSYDTNGNLTKHKVYTNGCGGESITTNYTLSADGKRTASTDSTEQSKTTFSYDVNGKLSGETTAFNNKESLQVQYFYDESGRIKEKIYSTNGTQYGKDVYEYSGDQKVPSKFIYHDLKAGKSLTIIYTNYEINSEGDWIKREETDNGKVSFVERAIEYYKD